MRFSDGVADLFLIGAFLLFTIVGGCAATKKAGQRRMAETRLASCMANRPCSQSLECFPIVAQWCLEQGLEASCGQGAMFINPPRCKP